MEGLGEKMCLRPDISYSPQKIDGSETFLIIILSEKYWFSTKTLHQLPIYYEKMLLGKLGKHIKLVIIFFYRNDDIPATFFKIWSMAQKTRACILPFSALDWVAVPRATASWDLPQVSLLICKMAIMDWSLVRSEYSSSLARAHLRHCSLKCFQLLFLAFKTFDIVYSTTRSLCMCSWFKLELYI